MLRTASFCPRRERSSVWMLKKKAVVFRARDPQIDGKK
jgi:hypothetical protein